MKSFFLPLFKKEQLTDTIWSFYFKRTGDEHDFKPGQYYEMRLDVKNPDERGNTRVFTICSSPTQKECIMFTTRIIQSTFKKSLLELEIGKSVQFDGPWDDLELQLDNKSPKVFLAGGIGVTPFHSIVKYCIDTKNNVPIILFTSWSRGDDVLFHDFFRDAERVLSRFKYIPAITGKEDIKDWDGIRGRIDQSVIERHVVNLGAPTYYIVGPEGFVKGVQDMLIAMRIEQEKIIPEHFSGY